MFNSIHFESTHILKFSKQNYDSLKSLRNTDAAM